jgi:hypothetical protein
MVDGARRELCAGTGDYGAVEMEVGYPKDKVCVMFQREFRVNCGGREMFEEAFVLSTTSLLLCSGSISSTCINPFYHNHTPRLPI